MEGAPIEFQNHSLQFPAAIVDCSYEVLKISMISYFNKSTPFKTVLPFGISAVKERLSWTKNGDNSGS